LLQCQYARETMAAAARSVR